MPEAATGASAELGDARALTAAGSTYDVVLLLGPLYHLLDREDRLKALAEAGRVVRPGGLVAAATIGRYASLVRTHRHDMARHERPSPRRRRRHPPNGRSRVRPQGFHRPPWQLTHRAAEPCTADPGISLPHPRTAVCRHPPPADQPEGTPPLLQPRSDVVLLTMNVRAQAESKTLHCLLRSRAWT
ncbi:class I SAM-dependent methyltransferase [Streptomyces sp. NPDC049597]|uniref:class I SAM-dependent methyltransferase n=1 Tax=Streptomyces sp. NPDC049597 TaxID=3155276 RepID=UPI00341E7707